jgi:hypothetical protein
MNVQTLLTGRTFVEYGKPLDYQSPLWIVSSSEAEVIYAASYEGVPVARVYKKDDEWYLSTSYLNHWQPIATFSKYEGFLLLLNIKKQNEL